MPGRQPQDEVLGVPSYFTLGFLRPGPEVFFGSGPRAFGAPGAGGFAFADPPPRLQGNPEAAVTFRMLRANVENRIWYLSQMLEATKAFIAVLRAGTDT